MEGNKSLFLFLSTYRFVGMHHPMQQPLRPHGTAPVPAPHIIMHRFDNGRPYIIIIITIVSFFSLLFLAVLCRQAEGCFIHFSGRYLGKVLSRRDHHTPLLVGYVIHRHRLLKYRHGYQDGLRQRTVEFLRHIEEKKLVHHTNTHHTHLMPRCKFVIIFCSPVYLIMYHDV